MAGKKGEISHFIRDDSVDKLEGVDIWVSGQLADEAELFESLELVVPYQPAKQQAEQPSSPSASNGRPQPPEDDVEDEDEEEEPAPVNGNGRMHL